MAPRKNPKNKPLPEDRFVYRVRDTRTLLWPRNVTARNRVYADSGKLVDLSHPVMREIFAGQIPLKLQRVTELPETAAVKGHDQVPRSVVGRILEHDRRAALPPTEDELAEALGVNDADLPDADRPERVQAARERLRKDIREELVQEIEAKLRAEAEASLADKEKELRDLLRKELEPEIRAAVEAEYDVIDDEEDEDEADEEVETDEDSDLSSIEKD